MPDEKVLRIVLDDGQLYDDAAARVVATMLYPNNEKRIEQLVAYSGERALHDAGFQIPRDLTAITHHGPSKKEFQTDANRRMKSEGWIVGQLLFLLTKLQTHRPVDASVRKAIYLLSEFQRDYVRHGFTVPSDARSIWRHWSKFKPVCHFWAAWRFFDYDIAVTANERLPELLAASEWMREFAESHFPPPRNPETQPLVAKGQLWKVPDLLILPPFEFDVPPLSDKERQRLDSYEAKKYTPEGC